MCTLVREDTGGETEGEMAPVDASGALSFGGLSNSDPTIRAKQKCGEYEASRAQQSQTCYVPRQ